MISQHGTYTNILKLQTPVVISSSHGTFKVKPPRFANAEELLAKESDMNKRNELQLYIQVVKSLALDKHKQNVKELKSMPFHDAIKLDELIKPFAPVLIMESLPEIYERVASPKPLPNKGKKKSPKKKSPKQKKSPKRLTPESQERIKQATLSKRLADLLPFKTMEECLSRSPKQKHYISKADLASLVGKNKVLKDKVGDKYNSMTKEEICKKLFSS